MWRMASFGLREPLVQQRQVVVAVGEVGIACAAPPRTRRALRRVRSMSSSSTPRLNSSTGSLPQALLRRAIDALGVDEAAAVVQQAPQVDARVERARDRRRRRSRRPSSAASRSAVSSATPRSNQLLRVGAGLGASLRSITLSAPLAGSPSNSSTYCPDSACQRPPPSRTTTRSATAPIARPGQRHASRAGAGAARASSA